MKKSAIAAAILFAGVSGSASAYQVVNSDDMQMSVGGYAEARYHMRSGNDGNADLNSDTTRARVNLQGQQKINDDLTGFGKFEVELSQQDDQTNRAAFAGVKGDFGSLSFGRNELTEGLVNARNLSDIQAEGVTDARNTPTSLSGWAGAQLTYYYNSDMFDLAAVYALEDEGEAEDNQGDAYAASAKINLDFGLSIGIGYGSGEYYADSDSDGDIDSVDMAFSKVEQDVVYYGLQYNIDQFTLGATYHDMGEDADKTGYEVVARYDMDKTTLTLAYMNKEEKDLGTGNEDTLDAIVVSGMYHFNSSLLAHASISFNDADDATYEQEARFAVKYTF